VLLNGLTGCGMTQLAGFFHWQGTPRTACRSAIAEALTDDAKMLTALNELGALSLSPRAHA